MSEYPFFDKLQSLLDQPIYDIFGHIPNYDDTLVYELERLQKYKTITGKKNRYSAKIIIYFSTLKSKSGHLSKALQILKTLENYNATAVIEMETIPMVINAAEFNVSRFELSFDEFIF